MREHGWGQRVTPSDGAAKDRAPSPSPAEPRRVPAQVTPPYAATSRVRAGDRSAPSGGDTSDASAAADGGGSPRPAALSSPGRPLDDDVAAALAPRVGFDPSGVRVHDDPSARRTAQQLGALAYTWGNHVGFAPGAFQPHTSKGQALLAHELAHVGQQLIGSTAPEHLQEAEADTVQRGGMRLPASPTGPPRPVLRLAVGDALSLTVVVGPDGRAAFSAEVEGGGIATGSGTATNLEPGEYRVRWATDRSDMVITNPDGTVVPTTTRFDVAAVAAYDPLVRALRGATTSVPLYVRPGPSGGRPGSSAAQRQQIAALPERLRQFLFREGGPPTQPSEYAALLRIAASVADLTEDELAEFGARASGVTSDVAVFEASVQRWLTELRARRGAEHEQQEAKDALTGLDAIYDAYRSFALAVDTTPGFPASLVEGWEAQPAADLPQSDPATGLDLYLRLRRALAARGIANVSAFATSITRFVTAFREHAYYVALDLLGRYEATLLQQQRRYQASGGASDLHTSLAPARTTYQQAEDYMASAQATYGGSWDPEDVMAYHAAGPEYQRQLGEGERQVRDLAASHPLLANEDFPREELGRTTSEYEVSLLVGRYIERRLVNVRDTRTRLSGDHELIFRLDVLVRNAKARQGITDDSIWDKIIQDHTAPSLGDIEREMMILTLTVALGILTAGTGSLALAAISLGVGTYQAVEAYQQYAFEHDAAGARLLSEEPSLAWVVLAVVGAGVDMAGVAALIRPLRPALRAFQRSGDLIALERALTGVAPSVRSSILSRASLLRALTSARAGLRSGAMRFRRISDFWPSGQITDGFAVGRVRGMFTTTGTLVDFKGLQTLGGGRVWVSQANITLDHVDDFVRDLVQGGRLSQGRTVHVVTGRHGPGDFRPAELGFYIQDLVHVQPGNPNVIIHNWAELTEAQLRPLLEGADDVVLAWCVSDETRSVANILVGNFW